MPITARSAVACTSAITRRFLCHSRRSLSSHQQASCSVSLRFWIGPRRPRGTLAKAKRIAARNGIVIDSFDGQWFEVSCPELEHDDPLEGRNATGDVREVLELVEEYRDCLLGGYLEAVTDPCLMN